MMPHIHYVLHLPLLPLLLLRTTDLLLLLCYRWGKSVPQQTHRDRSQFVVFNTQGGPDVWSHRQKSTQKYKLDQMLTLVSSDLEPRAYEQNTRT